MGLFFIQSSLFAKSITIQFQFEGAKEMKLYWGINDWQTIKPLPANTKITNQVMETPMQEKNGLYYCNIEVPENAVINAVFGFQKKGTIIGPTFYYLDNNHEQIYSFKASEGNIFSIQTNNTITQPRNNIGLLKYGFFLLLFFGSIAALIFIIQFRKSKSIFLFNKTSLNFWAIGFSFLSSLLIVRLQTAQIQYTFLSNPTYYFLTLSNAFIPDFLFVCIIAMIVGIAFSLLKNSRRFILVLFLSIALISIIIAIINISVVEVLGNPFNYPWLYYSDFLNSTDAKLAMSANVNTKMMLGNLLLLIACCCIFYISQFVFNKKTILVLSFFAVLLLPGLLIKPNHSIAEAKRVNPIVHFVLSTSIGDLVNKERIASASEMSIKNIDTSNSAYSQLFKKSGIKNVLVIVLESTPAAYLSVYDTSLSTTPFIRSIQKNSLVFNAIYAHVPATNKSLVGLLTATNPYVSFKSLTVEKPTINLLSIPKYLKKQGYRTGYFNAGDNQFQNAIGFLNNQSFDIIQDFHSNQLDKANITDDRYSNEQGNGMADSILFNQFTSWHSKKPNEPFFGMLWTFQTHYPYYDLGRSKNYHTGNINLERYLNSLSHADDLINKLYAYLMKQKLAESTLVVVVGDHGEAFGTHQQTTHANGIYEENLHVPLLFINPVLFNGEQRNVVGGIADIAPSILAALNKPIPNSWQGENLFSDNRRKRVYFFSPFSDFLVGFREGNKKFIFNSSTNTASLFDLSIDPHELHNIASDNKAYVDSAKQAVNAWVAYQNNFMKKLF